MNLANEFRPDEKKFSPPKEKKKLSKRREPTGELPLFREIYTERGGKCQITGVPLEFHPSIFAHILPKGQGMFPRFKLYKPNIYLVQFRIHDLYDHGTEEQLLKEFPGAKILFELYDKLEIEYNNLPTI